MARDAKSYTCGGPADLSARYRKANAVPGGGQDASRKNLAAGTSGTSIFDPVLCELAYRWFSPFGGVVLDPFAGGSVRGIVAAMLGRRYVGVDLRAEQVAANVEQADAICSDPFPVWHVGDSRNIAELVGPDFPGADFVFSCPPCGDLEVYSEDERDLSTMDYGEFLAAYSEIIAATCALLKPDRFACFVVGDFRGGGGFYRQFPWYTIQAFDDVGVKLYNEAVLLTAVGSLPIRAGKQFAVSRKLGKTHQNILVFCKGDPKVAAAACGDPKIPEAAFLEFEKAGQVQCPECGHVFGGAI